MQVLSGERPSGLLPSKAMRVKNYTGLEMAKTHSVEFEVCLAVQLQSEVQNVVLQGLSPAVCVYSLLHAADTVQAR